MLRITSDGKVRRLFVKRRDLLREHRLQPRDLRRLDTPADSSKASPSVTIKEDVLLLNLGGCRWAAACSGRTQRAGHIGKASQPRACRPVHGAAPGACLAHSDGLAAYVWRKAAGQGRVQGCSQRLSMALAASGRIMGTSRRARARPAPASILCISTGRTTSTTTRSLPCPC